MKKILLTLLLTFVTTISYAQYVEKIEYPITATTNIEKMEFCYLAQEKLRLEHNAKGKDFRDGKITQEQWDDYVNNEFRVKQDLIFQDILNIRSEFTKSTKYTINLKQLEKK